jgi:hypothetical protein
MVKLRHDETVLKRSGLIVEDILADLDRRRTHYNSTRNGA